MASWHIMLTSCCIQGEICSNHSTFLCCAVQTSGDWPCQHAARLVGTSLVHVPFCEQLPKKVQRLQYIHIYIYRCYPPKKQQGFITFQVDLCQQGLPHKVHSDSGPGWFRHSSNGFVPEWIEEVSFYLIEQPRLNRSEDRQCPDR